MARPALKLVSPVVKRARSSKTRKPKEQEIQGAIIQYLQYAPEVAWVTRMNSGMIGGFVFCSDVRKAMYSNRSNPDKMIHAIEGVMKRRQGVKLADKGTADIIGMLKGGRMFAFEVKRPGDKPREDQQEFLENIRIGGGFACVVESLKDVMEVMTCLTRQK